MIYGEVWLEITEVAENDIAKQIKLGDKSSVKKINSILSELAINPYTGIGKPEA